MVHRQKEGVLWSVVIDHSGRGGLHLWGKGQLLTGEPVAEHEGNAFSMGGW